MQNPGVALLELQELELVIAESEILHARLAPEVAGEVKARIPSARTIRTGETTGLSFDARTLSLFDVVTGRALKSATNEKVLAHG